MNEQKNMIRVVAKKDDSGHWYVIPAHLSEEFSELLNISIGESEQAQEAEDTFIEKFSQYMTGGDLNLIHLYTYPIDGTPTIDAHRKPSALDMVEEFHQAFNCPVYGTPSLPTYRGAYEEMEDLFEKIDNRFKYSKNTSRSFLRMKLIFEEYKEMCEGIRDGDFVKILDGLCDLLYVVYGTAHEFGLGPVLEEAISEVHRSNMSKLNGDGTPIVRNDGKILKGPNFTPPDLAGIIARFTRNQLDIKHWREAAEKAIKEGPGSPNYKGNNLAHYVGEDMPPADIDDAQTSKYDPDQTYPHR